MTKFGIGRREVAPISRWGWRSYAGEETEDSFLTATVLRFIETGGAHPLAQGKLPDPRLGTHFPVSSLDVRADAIGDQILLTHPRQTCARTWQRAS